MQERDAHLLSIHDDDGIACRTPDGVVLFYGHNGLNGAVPCVTGKCEELWRQLRGRLTHVLRTSAQYTVRGCGIMGITAEGRGEELRGGGEEWTIRVLDIPV